MPGNILRGPPQESSRQSAGENDWLIGILLDEPGQNFGYHKGEKVGIFPGRDADGNTFYYSNMTPDKELTEADLFDVVQNAKSRLVE